MEQIKEMVQPLYDSGDLLGYSVCGDTGEMIHNESFFSDKRAWQATLTFVNVILGLEKADRIGIRLTVELDDVTLIYQKLDQGHALFTLRSSCDLDTAAAVLS
jgi:hypothetical protein